jgi:hypothetical protein
MHVPNTRYLDRARFRSEFRVSLDQALDVCVSRSVKGCARR